MNLDLLTPTVEIGLVTTNLGAMVEFYEGFLGLEPQGDIESGDVSPRRYTLGDSLPFPAWVGCSSPIPTATRSSCSGPWDDLVSSVVRSQLNRGDVLTAPFLV